MENTQMPSFKVQIWGFNKEDGYYAYDIKVLSTGDNSFHVFDRYKNMRSLWESIKRDSEYPDRIPEFPPK